MRGGDDVGSRMRVAAVTCLVSSGLFVGGACGAVALAEPDSEGASTTADSPGRTVQDRTDQPRHTGPRGVTTVTRAGSGSPGQRTASPPVPTGLPVAPAPADPAGLPDAAAATDASKLPVDPEPVVAGVDDDEDEDEDDECGWGWWPLPPDTQSSAPNGGDGYGGGAPSAARPPAGRPGVPPGMNIPPRELLPESPVLPVIPDLAGPLPAIVVPPGVPGIAGSVGNSELTTPAPESPPPPAAGRVAPAERPAAPRTGDGQVVASSYRAGYGEYLRTAGMYEVAAVAVPGATGIMLLTGAGGFIGYRQARAGLVIRSRGAARFSS